jgi:hypothetical protein
MAFGIFGASLFLIMAFSVAAVNGATIWGWIGAILGLVCGSRLMWSALIRIRQGLGAKSVATTPSVWGIFGTVAVALVVGGPSLIVEPGTSDSWFSAGLPLWVGFSYFTDRDVDEPVKPSEPGWKMAVNLLAAGFFVMAFVVKVRTASDDTEWRKALLALVIVSGLVLQALMQWRIPLRPPWPGVRRPTLCAFLAIGSVVMGVAFELTKLPGVSAGEWVRAGCYLWFGTSGAITIGGSRVLSARHAKTV